jgi:hypothetical protein
VSRRFAAALLSGVLLLGGLSGCGIPEFAEVEVDGRARRRRPIVQRPSRRTAEPAGQRQ